MRMRWNLKRVLPARKRLWTERAVNMLGKMNDHEVARRLGVKSYVVWYKRKQLGVPAYRFDPWTKRWLKLLGTMPDRYVAKISGIHMRSVTRKRQHLKIPASWLVRHNWKKVELRLLGTMPDDDLAKRIGSTSIAVSVKRYQLGIACFGPPRQPKDVDELIERSGLQPQEVLATLLVLEVRRLCRQLPGKRYVKTEGEK